MSKTHPAVQGFMEAVYPGHAELVLSCFNEITALTDATETINTLRSQRDALREVLAEAGCVLEVYATNHSVIDKIDAILEATKEPV